MAIGAFAGLRSAEIERLEWSDIDLVSKQITIRKGVAKTASRRMVPIHDNLVEWLTPYAKETGKVWKGTTFGFYLEQQRASDVADVDWVQNGLRHSYISYRFAQLGDAGRIAGEAGNSPQMIYKHYLDLVKPADALKWFEVKPQSPANVVALGS